MSTIARLLHGVCLIGLMLFLVCPECTAEDQTAEGEATAEQVVQRLNEFYRRCETFSVDVRYGLQADGESKSPQDERRVVVARPNKVAVRPLGTSEGEYVCDGKQLLATMPSLDRFIQQDAGEDVDALLADQASMAMLGGRVAAQLASDTPLGVEDRELTLLEPSSLGEVECDRVELSQGRMAVVFWVQKGSEPFLRKVEWQLRHPDGAGDDGAPPAGIPLPVATLDNWEIGGNVPADTFALVVPEDMEKVDSFTEGLLQDDTGPHPLLGKEAPAFELPLLDGGSVKLQEHVNKRVVVLDFWAGWCGPCLESLPVFSKVTADFADRDVVFYSINLGDDEETVRGVLKERELELPVVMDTEGTLAETYSASSIPQTVIIDKQGVVQVVLQGISRNHEKELTDKIESVLAGEPLAEQTLEAARDVRDPTGPIPQDPDATTEKDLAVTRLAYNRRTLVGAYKEHGSRKPAWDGQALELLEEVARHFSSAPECKSREEIRDMAEDVLDSGCDDPMVKYCYAAFLQDTVEGDEAQDKAVQLLKESYHGLVERGYPANRRYAAARRVFDRIKKSAPRSEETHEFHSHRINEVLAVIPMDDVSNNEGRYLGYLLFEVYADLAFDLKAKFYDHAKAYEDEQPYLVNLIGGQWHLDAAWKARGGGWASEVTDEGWEGFSEHIEKARVCLEKAWEAAPNRPEVSTVMIQVAMADGGASLRQMRLWFDRAVEAQIDHRQAYYNLMFGMYPRWHGSHGTLYQFGLRCKETERYDTDVPFMLCEALWRIAQDSQNEEGLRALNRPGVYEEVHEVAQRYIKVSESDSYSAWWKSVDMAFAYCTEHWDEAAALLDELDEEVDPDALGRFPLDRDTVVAEVRLHTSPLAETLIECLGDDGEKDRQELIEQLTELESSDDLHPLVLQKIRSRLQDFRWKSAYESGEELELKTDPGMHGWQPIAGTWEVKPDGTLQGVSGKLGVISVCNIDLGPRWELSGEWEYGKSPYKPWYAGVFFCQGDKPVYCMMYHPSENWISVGPIEGFKKLSEPFEREGKTVPFRVRFNDGVVDVWIDDQLVIENRQLPGWADEEPIRFGIGARYKWDGSALKYRKLKITKLD